MVQLQPSTQPDIIYPDSDGRPMADNTKQFRWIVVIKENLELLFADRALEQLEAERQRNQLLMERLCELGVDPDQLSP